MSRWRSPRIIVWALLLASGAGWGAETPGGSALTLQQAVTAALRDSPELAAFEPRLRAQSARAAWSALRPAPEVSLGIENAVGTGDTSGFSAAETTLALSQVIELGGKRDARIAVGAAEGEWLTTEFVVRELDVLTEVTRRFIAVAAQQEQLKLAQTGQSLAEKLVTAVEHRVAAARSPHAELDRARIALDRARLIVARAEAQLDAARHTLAATWGADRESLNGRPIGPVRADLYALPSAGTFDDLAARLKSNPDYLRFATELQLRDAELRLARAQARPDPVMSLGVRRLEASNDQALVASVSVPLFARRRSSHLVAEAEANRDLVGAEVWAARVRARTVLYELFRGLQSEIRTAETLRKELLPRAEEALRETQYAYERGRYSFVELVDAQREFLDLQAALIEASAQAHLRRADIERLTREPITDDAP